MGESAVRSVSWPLLPLLYCGEFHLQFVVEGGPERDAVDHAGDS